MFCKNCGKELCEQAFVCPDCGCLTNNTTEKSTPATGKANDPIDKKGVLKILTMISFGCFCLAFIFAFIALTDPHIKAGGLSYQTYVYAYVYFYAIYVIPTFVLGLCSFGTGLTGFIMGLKKEIDDTTKLMCVFNFMLSVAIVGVSIALMASIW